MSRGGIALFGLLVPNGLLVDWLVKEFHGLGFSVPFTWWLSSRPAKTSAA